MNGPLSDNEDESIFPWTARARVEGRMGTLSISENEISFAPDQDGSGARTISVGDLKKVTLPAIADSDSDKVALLLQDESIDIEFQAEDDATVAFVIITALIQGVAT